MKKFVLTLIILLAICTAFFVALSMPRGMGDARAIDGILDLTHADFTQTRYNLDGEWEFFFGELLTPEDFANAEPSGGTRINVPASWHYAGYPRYGFATYRLIIKTYEPSLMMLLPQITSASVVWVNGEKVLESVTISIDPPMEEHGAVNVFVPFSPIEGQVEIIIQAANFTWFNAGLRSSIEMGTPENLIRDAVFRRVMLALFIGMLVAMFLYHILLFIYYRGEWVYFAFAVFCFLTAVVFTLETDGLLHLFWGRGVVIRDILQVITIMTAASFTLFTHIALKIPFGKFRGIAYGVLFGIPSLMVILIPAQMLDRRFVYIVALAAPILFFSILLISGFAELSQMQVDENMADENTSKNLSTISDEAKRLALLVDKLLDVSAAKEGATGRVRVSVPDIMSRAVALCNPILAANGNRLDVQIEKDCPYILANPDMLIQILFNLANNANRHTKNGVFVITAQATHDMVQFQVQDNGAGIPAHMLDKIFERGVCKPCVIHNASTYE